VWFSVQKVHQFGAQKYGPWNWRDVAIQATPYFSAENRHLRAIAGGEDIDPKSGEPHYSHVAAGNGIVLDAYHWGSLIDDRPQSNLLPQYRRRPKVDLDSGDDIRTLVVRSLSAFGLGYEPFLAFGDAILDAAIGAEIVLKKRSRSR
jgi:hypothetical protein